MRRVSVFLLFLFPLTRAARVTPPAAPSGPTSADQCKKGGWMTFTNPTFKNQGDCVSYVGARARRLPGAEMQPRYRHPLQTA